MSNKFPVSTRAPEEKRVQGKWGIDGWEGAPIRSALPRKVAQSKVSVSSCFKVHGLLRILPSESPPRSCFYLLQLTETIFRVKKHLAISFCAAHRHVSSRSTPPLVCRATTQLALLQVNGGVSVLNREDMLSCYEDLSLAASP